MSLVKALSVLFFLFTIGLVASRKKFKKTYILFGTLTYIFIIGYAFIPSIPTQFQSLAIFLVFSIMIANFGLMNGFIVLMFGKSNKTSIITSITTATLFMLFLFNIKGLLTYAYVPVGLYAIQRAVNNKIIKIN